MDAWTAIPVAFIAVLLGIATAIRARDRDRAADAERLAEKLAAPARESAEKLSTLRGEVSSWFGDTALAASKLEAKLDRVAADIAELRKGVGAGADAGHAEIEELRGMIEKLDRRVRELENWRHRRSGPSGPHETRRG